MAARVLWAVRWRMQPSTSMPRPRAGVNGGDQTLRTTMTVDLKGQFLGHEETPGAPGCHNWALTARILQERKRGPVAAPPCRAEALKIRGHALGGGNSFFRLNWGRALPCPFLQLLAPQVDWDSLLAPCMNIVGNQYLSFTFPCN